MSYMRQMVFAYVFVQGWIVDPYVYSFLYQPHEVLILPPHYAKVFKCSAMTCDVTVVIEWGGVLEMFSKPLSFSHQNNIMTIHCHIGITPAKI